MPRASRDGGGGCRWCARGMNFTRSDVDRSFNSVYVDRGARLEAEGGVISCVEGESSLEAEVVGSRGDIYRVAVAWARKGGSRVLSGSCTCPFEIDCKHAAAACLHHLRHAVDDEDGGLPEPPPGTSREAEARPASRHERLGASLETWLSGVESAFVPPPEPESPSHVVLYLLDASRLYGLTVTLCSEQVSNGAKKAFPKLGSIPKAVLVSMTQEDRALREMLHSQCREVGYTAAEYALAGAAGEALLWRIAAAGKAQWKGARVLGTAERAPLRLEWKTGQDGRMRMQVLVNGRPFPASDVAPLHPAVCFDQEEGLLIPLSSPFDARQVSTLLAAPEVPVEDAMALRRRLEAMPLPEALLPQSDAEVRIVREKPVPVLRCDVRLAAYEGYYSRSHTPRIEQWIPYLTLAFSYQGASFNKDVQEIRTHEGGVLTIIKRDPAFERVCEERLRDWAWTSGFGEWKGLPKRYNARVMLPDTWVDAAHLARYARWLKEEMPLLQAEGWDVQAAGPWTILETGDLEWGLTVTKDAQGARARLTGKADGKPVNMAGLLERIRAMGPERKGVPQPPVLLQVSEGAMMLLSPAKLAQAIQTLTAILGDGLASGEEAVIPPSEFGSLALLEDEGVTTWAPPAIKDLAKKLNSPSAIAAMDPHPGFGASLRPYQKEGLGWMAFLEEHGFNGILADDMGLGKTVQVLALIHRRREEGRLSHPVLVVSPTSVLPNWKKEIARFAPGLKVGILHGSSRGEVLKGAEEHDVLLTTYPLLARDRDSLAGLQFSMIFADEAQAVKNPSTASAKALKSLSARFRMALSGTPIENHLGELWSLFSFLMPGFLGSHTSFTKSYRSASPEARRQLARRVRPFIMRRTREQVLDELPPRVEIIEEVELAEGQKELYERVSLAADKSVREIFKAQGLQGGRFQILEILLRMRQICLDPRLIESEGKRQPGAKIIRLVEMLEILLSEGRRALIFSQFTSFLDLIEEALAAQGWKWATLRGDTRDRSAPVEAFQSGEVPIFLVSLKAGGSGLNLTAADTVILCDPWWNPAVEDQAMGRAHRMGQTRSVTVYRLIAADTVETRMLELQQHKKDLASAITDEAAMGGLTADEFLFAVTGAKEGPSPA